MYWYLLLHFVCGFCWFSSEAFKGVSIRILVDCCGFKISLFHYSSFFRLTSICLCLLESSCFPVYILHWSSQLIPISTTDWINETGKRCNCAYPDDHLAVRGFAISVLQWRQARKFATFLFIKNVLWSFK